MRCYVCKGDGELHDYIDHQLANVYTCYECAGKGKYSVWHRISSWFWQDIAPVRFVEWLVDVHLWLHKEDESHEEQLTKDR